MARIVPLLTPRAEELLGRLAEARGVSPAQLLEELVLEAARGAGLTTPAAEPEPFLLLEATDEVPAIGPEGRGRRVHLKAIDETGEWDAGELFVPEPPPPPRKG